MKKKKRFSSRPLRNTENRGTTGRMASGSPGARDPSLGSAKNILNFTERVDLEYSAST